MQTQERNFHTYTVLTPDVNFSASNNAGGVGHDERMKSAKVWGLLHPDFARESSSSSSPNRPDFDARTDPPTSSC
jgi:hypothetical protein